jgi:hypothetical protein
MRNDLKNLKNGVFDATEGRFGCCSVLFGAVFSIISPFFEHQNPK